MTQHIASGTLQHFIFDNIPVRGIVLRMDNLALHVSTIKHKNEDLNNALAEMISASALLASDLKHNANITMQIHTSGDVPLLVAQCDTENDIRAYANITPNANIEKLEYTDIAAKEALMMVSVEQQNPHNVYQSMVRVNSESIASSLEQYFNDSVQLDTYFRVMTAEQNGDLKSGMIFLQALPQEEKNEDDWARLGIILDTIKQAEMVSGDITIETLLMRLFAEDKVRVFTPETLHFDLSKNRKRMEKALVSIGVKECKDLLAQEGGQLEMTCEFTGRKEAFNEENMRDIFGTDWDA